MRKPPRVYVLGSSHFMKEMVACSERLRELGYDGWIHPDYEAFVRGEKQHIVQRWSEGDPTEHAKIKKENNYLKSHYSGILESDAMLFVNAEKRGVKNYIGGNVLIEMGQCFVNDKKIFLLYDVPSESPYLAEIQSMDPIPLHGRLEDIGQHLPLS